MASEAGGFGLLLFYSSSSDGAEMASVEDLETPDMVVMEITVVAAAVKEERRKGKIVAVVIDAVDAVIDAVKTTAAAIMDTTITIHSLEDLGGYSY